MTIYSGRRSASPSTSPRLFVLQGELPEETFLKEVPCELDSLRARGVFFLILPFSRLLFLWLGQASEPHQVEAGKIRAEAWSRDPPEQLGCRSLEFDIVEQGQEPAGFLKAFRGGSSELLRLTREDVRLPSTPRLFHMTSVLGAFEVTEVRPDWVHTGITCPLLHSQVDTKMKKAGYFNNLSQSINCKYFRHGCILRSNQHYFCWTQEQSSTFGKAGSRLPRVRKTTPTCSRTRPAVEKYAGTQNVALLWGRLWSIGGHGMGTLCQGLSWSGLGMNPGNSPISSPLGKFSQRWQNATLR